MKLRRDLTTDNIKTYKDFKRARRLKKKGERFNGESYSNLTTFTYRNFANKYGLSLSSLHDLVDLLKKSNQIGIKTVTKLYKKPINCNPKFIKDLIKLKSYFYFDSKK